MRLKQIDHLIATHYHVDHVGGLEELAKRIPSGSAFVDNLLKPYATITSAAQHTVAKPGDKIPVEDLTVDVVTSATQVIKAPMARLP